jgi:dihydropteroate synthase
MSAPVWWAVSADRGLSLDGPRIMGILNVTPDSFSDGASWPTVASAVDGALEMQRHGADIVDVGAESTRPGAARVAAAEQVDRAVPVIERLRRRSDVIISVDTTLAAVAAAALDAGADIVNDVSAGTEDPGMLDLAAERRCGLVLMHRRLGPEGERYSDRYDEEPPYQDVVAEVRAWLLERCAAAESAGVARDAVVIDPGLGFGKSVRQNFELIRRVGELVATGYPVLSAASRKSFIGAVSGVSPPARRAFGSAAVSVMHWLAGVRLFRVHDIAAHREALAVAAAGAGPRPAASAAGGPDRRA